VKISKSTWIAVVVGVVGITGLSLGMALNQQTTQKADIESKLTVVKEKMAAFENDKLIDQKEQLILQMDEYKTQTATIKSKLSFPDDNISITNSLIQNAADCKVDILEISSGGVSNENLGGLQYKAMAMSVRAQGTTRTIAEFVYSLKKIFPTGILKSVTMEISEPTPTPTVLSTETPAAATGNVELKDTIVKIDLTIYNYIGE
jgi:hypothetical protein